MSVTDTVRRELDEILSEPLSSVVARERNTLDQLLASHNNKVVLFGAGNLGKQTLACLRSIGVEPLAFSDNNEAIWNTSVENVPVLAPSAAAQRFGSDVLFLVTIWKPNHWYEETWARLANLGVRSITPPSAVYWRFMDVFLPFYAQDAPARLLTHADDIARASSIWDDERSAAEYLRHIRWRMRGEWTFSREPEESYFPDSLFRLVPGEVFVDCGAFDGDTIRAIVSRQPDFGHIFAVEPGAVTFAKLESCVDNLGPDIRQRITLFQGVVGTERGMVKFTDTGDLGSHVGEQGDAQVSSTPIDDLVREVERTTYIKMDIEGAEPEALLGAENVICRDHPILAICVYHKPEHLWQLPLAMKAAVPDYRMYLRCHEGDGWQTVAYAVPRHRMTA